MSSKPNENFKKIEGVINKWTEKVEEQINLIQNNVDTKPSHHDLSKSLESLKAEINEDLEKLFKITENSEKVSSRLAEDVFESIDIRRRTF